tara:strand:+ start:175 stop:1077 length:903 start_codon:yes stop_codon:yes gene_type:complete
MNKPFFSRKTNKNFFWMIGDWILIYYLSKRSKFLSQERGAPIAVFANDWIGANIFLKGIYEKDIIDDLFYVIDELDKNIYNNCILDVGANIGNHSIQFSKKFDKILSFEPHKRIFEILSSNVKQFKNIKCFNFGLGKKNCQINLFENQQNFGASSFTNTSQTKSHSKVEIKKLDDFFSKMTQKISLIKIDVEGMEYDVLLGAKNIIEQNKPIICFEQNKKEFGNNCNETNSVDLLRANGYKILVGEMEKDHMKQNWIYRRLRNIFWIFFGVTQNRIIKEYERLPKKDYKMIFAIHESRFF